jgi:hypothetical protein
VTDCRPYCDTYWVARIAVAQPNRTIIRGKFMPVIGSTPTSHFGGAIVASVLVVLAQKADDEKTSLAVVAALSPLLTVVMVTVVSVAISGAVLSSALNLSTAGGNHLTIRIPFDFRYSLTGHQVTAAFLPWMIALLMVIVADAIKAPVVRDVVDALIETAGGRFPAAQLLAALVSCPICLLLSLARMTLVGLIAITWIAGNAPPSPEARAASLVGAQSASTPVGPAPAGPSPASE